MQVLFLGGPWHGERHDVAPCRRTRGADALPVQYSVSGVVAAGASGATPSADRVTYVRRFAQGRGERLPVYVAPDYHGPARA